MASLHCQAGFSATFSYSRERKQRIKVGRFSKIITANVNARIQTAAVSKNSGMVSAAPMTEVGFITETQTRQNIPTKKQLVDPYRQGIIVEGGVGYRQTVVIRSYEVGADKTATLESLLNLLQETALNHVWVSGLLSDGFGATHGMVRNNLIWVVTRMQLQVDQYPIWGEVVEVDTWVGALGKNGMRRDWLIRSHVTGQVHGRATSNWVMMNQKTRRLSKMPEEVRAEISPWFIEKNALIEDEAPQTIRKLDNTAMYINSKLKPKRTDLDMNHHVNNVKYVNWMLETIPEIFLEGYQLFSITLEYRRECGRSDTVQSLCQPDEDFVLREDGVQDNGNYREQLQAELEGDASPRRPSLSFIHLLQMTMDSKTDEIPKRTDLDINQHVNNVQYANWMLEAIPENFHDGYQLFSITLEYKRESGCSDTVQSLCQTDEDQDHKNYKEQLHAESEGDASPRRPSLSFTHLLQMTMESKTEEIVRRRTTWKRKQ